MTGAQFDRPERVANRDGLGIVERALRKGPMTGQGVVEYRFGIAFVSGAGQDWDLLR